MGLHFLDWGDCGCAGQVLKRGRGRGREWGRRGRYYYLSGSDVRKNLWWFRDKNLVVSSLAGSVVSRTSTITLLEQLALWSTTIIFFLCFYQVEALTVQKTITFPEQMCLQFVIQVCMHCAETWMWRKYFSTQSIKPALSCDKLVFVYHITSRSGIVGTATKLRAGRSRVLYPLGATDRLWFPTSLVFNGHKCYFLVVKQLMLKIKHSI